MSWLVALVVFQEVMVAWRHQVSGMGCLQQLAHLLRFSCAVLHAVVSEHAFAASFAVDLKILDESVDLIGTVLMPHM